MLVIPGVNIGDAIMAQAFIAPFKRTDPSLRISYVYQKKAYPLVRENPDIDLHFPVFQSLGYPTRRDVQNLRQVLEQSPFDLIVNISPYFSRREFQVSGAPVIFPSRLIARVLRAYAQDNQKAQLIFHMERMAQEMLQMLCGVRNPRSRAQENTPSIPIYATTSVHEKTRKIFRELGVPSSRKRVMFNPDTSSRYTLIPLPLQRRLLEGILSIKDVAVLLNRGFTFTGIEKRLIKHVPEVLKRRIVLIPEDVPIDVYASLTDHSDLFVSGDTAPLHIAAARKVVVDSGDGFRNATAVVGVFGATDARIYGYDSTSEKYLDTSQSAPSKVFEASPPCKNLTCIDKVSKTCVEPKCFEGLDPEPIIAYIRDYLS